MGPSGNSLRQEWGGGVVSKRYFFECSGQPTALQDNRLSSGNFDGWQEIQKKRDGSPQQQRFGICWVGDFFTACTHVFLSPFSATTREIFFCLELSSICILIRQSKSFRETAGHGVTGAKPGGREILRAILLRGKEIPPLHRCSSDSWLVIQGIGPLVVIRNLSNATSIF